MATPQNTVMVLPVFIRQEDIPSKYQKDGLEICLAVASVVGNSTVVDGAQLKMYPGGKGLWRIYITAEEARAKLLSEGLSLGPSSVTLYSQNPFATGNFDPDKKSTRVCVKELPNSVSVECVKDMLKNLGLKGQVDLKQSYYRFKDGKLSTFKTGDWFFYVEEEVLNKAPLPRVATCGPFTCKIFHDGQPTNPGKNECAACRKTGHKAGDDMCQFHVTNQGVEAFGGNKDCLSNFFPCEVVYEGMSYKSSEHAYQAEKARKCGRPDLVPKIVGAKNAFQAKQASKDIACDKKWEEQNVHLMEQIVAAKVESVPEVKAYLINTGSRPIAEAVPFSTFWGTGLAREATLATDKSRWPGQNEMGRVLEKIRADLQRDITLKEKKENVSPVNSKRTTKKADKPTTSRDDKSDKKKKGNQEKRKKRSETNSEEHPKRKQKLASNPVGSLTEVNKVSDTHVSDNESSDDEKEVFSSAEGEHSDTGQ